jgi:hypothetical protein
MRTTLTLDPDVAAKLKVRTAEQGATFKRVVNETLRRGLKASPAKASPKFRVKARSLGLRAGVDPYKLNQLADELETQAWAAANRRRSQRG